MVMTDRNLRWVFERSAPLCWADGPEDERGVGSACTLDKGHRCDHVFEADDEVRVTFTPGGRLMYHVLTPASDAGRCTCGADGAHLANRACNG